jgi:G:T-mismatch repair DNA endonuclease (very short patch repair protein)
MKINCDNCNIEFDVRPYILREKEEGKRKHICCSRKCLGELQSIKMSGENNPLYKERIIKVCEYCGKEYDVKPSKSESSKYCSRECKDNHRVEKSEITIMCDTCGKEMVVKKGEVTKGKKYCSNECCAKGKENKVEKICIICGKEYSTHNRRSDKSVTCSNDCKKVWQSEIYSKKEEVIERLKGQGVKASLIQQQFDTKPELMVKDYLDENKIRYEYQKVINNILIADFYLTEYDVLLEVYGDYWHSNPAKYGKGLIPLNETQSKIKSRDIARHNVLTKKLGYKVFYVWENDIYKNVSVTLENVIEKIHQNQNP